MDSKILEVAILNIREGQTAQLEAAFQQASPLIASMPGFIAHELQKCVEATHRYLLLVSWQTLEAHTIGFRESPEYQEWKRLLHHFYDRASLRFIFDYLLAYRVRLECDDTNSRSQRVAERCGMIKEAHIRENKKRADGTFSGTLHFGLLRSRSPNIESCPVSGNVGP